MYNRERIMEDKKNKEVKITEAKIPTKITRKRVSGISKELESSEWMKNPLVYSQVSADMTLMQREIIISIAASLQNRIGEFLQRKKNGGTQLSLFEDEIMNKDVYEFRIKTSELNVRPDAYDELDQACKELAKMFFSYTSYDEKEKCYVKHYTSLFSDISFPVENNRRKGYIKVLMLTQNMKALFDMRNGYVEHLRKIVPMCRRHRTPGLYIYLSKYKNLGHKIVPFTDLKGFMNDYVFDGTGKLVEEKNPKFVKFRQRVLDPVKNEMDELAKANRIDFSFDYEARYHGRTKIGNPDAILFTIKLSEMGKNHRKKTVDKLHEFLVSQSFSEDEILRLLSNKNLDSKEHVYNSLLKNRKHIEHADNAKSYIYKCVIDSFDEYEQKIINTAQDIISVEDDVPVVDDYQKSLWLSAWESITSENSEAYMWQEAIELSEVSDDKVFLDIPTRTTYEMIRMKFGGLITDKVREKFGKEVVVRIRN